MTFLTLGVAALAKLPLLESLTLSGWGITDATMPAVANDRGLANLAVLPRLQSLSLNCIATDAGLRELLGSKSLHVVTLASPNMTDEAFASARASNTTIKSLRRGEFRISNRVVSKSKIEGDRFWRLGTSRKRKELNALETEMAPEITASQWINTDGATSLVDLHGKVVLIDFWGSWCGPCLAQLPEIRRLRDKYAERGLVVLGVHSTQGSSRGIESNGIDWVIGLDDSEQTNSEYHVPGWPSVYLIDKRGILRIALPLPGELDAAIQTLLAE